MPFLSLSSLGCVHLICLYLININIAYWKHSGFVCIATCRDRELNLWNAQWRGRGRHQAGEEPETHTCASLHHQVNKMDNGIWNNSVGKGLQKRNVGVWAWYRHKMCLLGSNTDDCAIFSIRVTAIKRLTVAQQTKWVNIECTREYSLTS